MTAGREQDPTPSSLIQHVLWLWETAEERDDPDATAAAYATPLTLPDGRVVALGGLTPADLATVRARAAAAREATR